MTTEAKFQAAIMIAASKIPGMRVWRQNVGSVKKAGGGMFHAGPPKGAADISGIYAPSGRRVEIEVKAAGKKPRPEQIKWGSFIHTAGGIYVLAVFDKRRTLADNVASVVEAILYEVTGDIAYTAVPHARRRS